MNSRAAGLALKCGPARELHNTMVCWEICFLNDKLQTDVPWSTDSVSTEAFWDVSHGRDYSLDSGDHFSEWGHLELMPGIISHNASPFASLVCPAFESVTTP